MTEPYDDYYALDPVEVGKSKSGNLPRIGLYFADPVRSNWDPDSDYWTINVAFINHDTGEIREQTVALPWTRTWRETAARRMERIHEDFLTPQVIIPQKRVR